jgi:hypothetical protein
MHRPAPFVNDAPLSRLPARDLIVMMYVVALGISRLRWPVPGGDDLAALRHELRRREGLVAA